MSKLLIIVGIAMIAWLLMTRKKTVRMPRTEAAKLLGLPANAGSEDVIDAHRRLIAKVHPDAGGNAELAARINQARDTLLRS